MSWIARPSTMFITTIVRMMMNETKMSLLNRVLFEEMTASLTSSSPVIMATTLRRLSSREVKEGFPGRRT